MQSPPNQISLNATSIMSHTTSYASFPKRTRQVENKVPKLSDIDATSE